MGGFSLVLHIYIQIIPFEMSMNGLNVLYHIPIIKYALL